VPDERDSLRKQKGQPLDSLDRPAAGRAADGSTVSIRVAAAATFLRHPGDA
jgi:hypothetical protein